MIDFDCAIRDPTITPCLNNLFLKSYQHFGVQARVSTALFGGNLLARMIFFFKCGFFCLDLGFSL
jgi:hypothetical protein